MQPYFDKTIERLLQKHVLSLFLLPDGDVIWQGDSELDIQSIVYFFYIGNNRYLLVNESYHGVGDGRLTDRLVGNAIAPHQRIMPVLPKKGTHTYVSLSNKKFETMPRFAGDFSVFRILN